MAKSTYHFVNTDEYIDFPKPIFPKLVYVGGLAKIRAKPLDEVISS